MTLIAPPFLIQSYQDRSEAKTNECHDCVLCIINFFNNDDDRFFKYFLKLNNICWIRSSNFRRGFWRSNGLFIHDSFWSADLRKAVFTTLLKSGGFRLSVFWKSASLTSGYYLVIVWFCKRYFSNLVPIPVFTFTILIIYLVLIIEIVGWNERLSQQMICCKRERERVIKTCDDRMQTPISENRWQSFRRGS